MLRVDSREHWTHPGSRDRHLKDYFDRHGITYRVEKLDVGDYMLDGGSLVIDRKSGLQELSTNLTNAADNARFMREVRRAYHSGIKLVILIEQRGITCHDDVSSWRSKHTGVSGAELLKQAGDGLRRAVHVLRQAQLRAPDHGDPDHRENNHKFFKIVLTNVYTHDIMRHRNKGGTQHEQTRI